MLFPSPIFLFAFLPTFLVLYFCVKDKYKNFVLFICSIIFYAYGELIYVFLMLALLIYNFFMGILIENKCKKKKKYFIFTISVNIIILIVFKYIGFFISVINQCFTVDFEIIDIKLPLGISFYTFQMISYIIDVYKNKIKAQHKFTYLGAYLAAFPQLIAGPIVRYKEIESQLSKKNISMDHFVQGFRRFTYGLGKKCFIANILGRTVDSLILEEVSNIGLLGVLIIGIAYTLQIYFDFSGYSDMAIGLGKILGFNYPENFDYPYTAKTVTEFWRRWHMTLTRFFRDYIYIPLGGNRVGKFRHIFNILIVWCLTGFWHGAQYTMIVWGLYFAVVLILEKFIIGKYISKLPIIRNIYTLSIVVISFVIFRSNNLGQAIELIQALFGKYGFLGALDSIELIFTHNYVNGTFVIALIAGIILSMPIFKVIEGKVENGNRVLYSLRIVLVSVIFIFSIIYILSSSYNPFIYFKF